MYTYIFNSEYLRTAIDKTGYKCVAIAEKLGVLPQKIYQYRQGATTPDAKFLGELCTLLNIEPNYFFDMYETHNSFYPKLYKHHCGIDFKSTSNIKYVYDHTFIDFYRHKEHLRLEDVAEYSWVNMDSVRQWSRGKHCPRVNKLGAICGPLNVSPSDFYTKESMEGKNVYLHI